MYFKCNRNELIKASLTNDPWLIRAQDSCENHDIEVEELCRVRDVCGPGSVLPHYLLNTF